MHDTYQTTTAPKSVTRPTTGAADDLRRAARRPADPPQAPSTPTRVRPSPRARLPELAPVGAPVQPQRHFVGLDMTSQAVIDEETRFSKREETRSDTARLTVYVLNATLLIMAFPVGFGMLVFNLLGGENLRTTAHVMALTGMGIALSSAGVGAQFLGHI